MASELLMDPGQTERFDSACAAAGARFVGGLFAWPGVGGARIHRRAHLLRTHPRFPDRFGQLHDAGLVHGLVPITVPIGAASFGDAAWPRRRRRLGSGHGESALLPRAGTGAVAGLAAAELPGVELLPRRRRAAERHPRRRRPGPGNNIGIYPDGRYSHQLTIYIFRYGEGTAMAIMHPDNAVAPSSPSTAHVGHEVRLRAGR